MKQSARVVLLATFVSAGAWSQEISTFSTTFVQVNKQAIPGFDTKTMPTNFLIGKGGEILAISAGCDPSGLIAKKLSEKIAKTMLLAIDTARRWLRIQRCKRHEGVNSRRRAAAKASAVSGRCSGSNARQLWINRAKRLSTWRFFS